MGSGYGSSSTTPTTTYPRSTGSGYGSSSTTPTTTYPRSTGSGYGSSNSEYDEFLNPERITDIDPVTRSKIEGTARVKNISNVYFAQSDPVIGDIITGFNRQTDVIALSIDDLPLTPQKPKLKVVKNAKQLQKALMSKRNYLVYDLRSGNLLLDANGKEDGFGDDGGIIAVIENKSRISSGNIALL